MSQFCAGGVVLRMGRGACAGLVGDYRNLQLTYIMYVGSLDRYIMSLGILNCNVHFIPLLSGLS